MKVTLQTHAPTFFSAQVDGGLSRGSSVRRTGSKDPHRHELYEYLLVTISDPLILPTRDAFCLLILLWKYIASDNIDQI